MIEHIGRVNMDYMVRLANDPDRARDEMRRIEAYNAEQGALFGKDPIPVSIKPNFISPRQRELIETAVSGLLSALNRFVDLWLDSQELQDLWGVSDPELELLKADPGYDHPIQVARFDGFLQNHKLKFIEFNCDSPGGAGYSDVIGEAFNDLFQRDHGFELATAVNTRQRTRHLADALIHSYREWRARGHRDRPDEPFTVVTDWRDVGSLPDIEITVRKFNENGLDAVFADPRDLVLEDDGLYLGERRVDLVYKRVIVKELVAEPEAKDLAEAYLQGQVCMVNSPRSVIVGNKKILAALRRPDVMAALTPEERQAVRDHVPWTEILREGRAEFKGFTVNLKDFVVDNREKLVLKAAQSYGGKDVFLGFETTQEKWEALVEEHIHGNAWVVQALVEIPKELFPRVTDDDIQMELLNVNINPFVFGGRYAGSYTRVSRANVINVSKGGGIAPTMTVAPPEGGP